MFLIIGDIVVRFSGGLMINLRRSSLKLLQPHCQLQNSSLSGAKNWGSRPTFSCGDDSAPRFETKFRGTKNTIVKLWSQDDSLTRQKLKTCRTDRIRGSGRADVRYVKKLPSWSFFSNDRRAILHHLRLRILGLG